MIANLFTTYERLALPEGAEPQAGHLTALCVEHQGDSWQASWQRYGPSMDASLVKRGRTCRASDIARLCAEAAYYMQADAGMQPEE